VGGGANNVLTQNVRTDGSGLITYTTTSTSFDGFAQDQLTLWTTSDPGTDLLNPATPRDVTGPGYRGGFVNATATIDISGLASGTVNIFYGDFRGKPNVSVVMKDTNGASPDLNIADVHLNGDTANRAEYYVAEVEFVNDAGYGVIEYVYTATGDNGTNGRFGGTVLTGTDAPPVAFAITAIDYDSATSMLTLTWTSNPGETYAVKYSPDMTNWDADLDDGIDADAGGGITTGLFDLSLADLQDAARLFFRVEKQP